MIINKNPLFFYRISKFNSILEQIFASTTLISDSAEDESEAKNSRKIQY